MSKFAKFYAKLRMTSLTSWIFAAVLTDRGPANFFCIRCHAYAYVMIINRVFGNNSGKP